MLYKKLSLIGMILAFFAPGLRAGGVEISMAPDPVLIVRGNDVQKLNFDFLVRNTGGEPLVILAVRLSVFDEKGAMVTRREINRMGMRPSVGTLGVTEIPGGGTVDLYNPFHEFPEKVPLADLRYEFTLTPQESEGDIKAEVVVHPKAFHPRTALRLPLEGKVFISDGSDFYAHHRRIDMAHPFMVQLGMAHSPSRYGMDFEIADDQGRTFSGKGDKPEDYFIFGRPILAPAAGTVADCIDGRVDGSIGKAEVDYDELLRTKNGRLMGGNYVVLDHGNGEYSFFAHIKKGSVKVKKGDHVRSGQILGLAGNSGDSYWPHLHYQLQSGSGFDVESLPAVFTDFKRYYGSDSEKVKAGTVDTGDIVKSR
jgi:hypothetical protein